MPPSAPSPSSDPAFVFRDPGSLHDGELSLVLDYRSPADPVRGWIPAYHFGLRVASRRVGGIELRVGRSGRLLRGPGNVGYFVVPECRGRGYAARAGRLILPLARAHGLDPLWINCEEVNGPSRRTCERLGAVLVEIVPPVATPAAARGGYVPGPTCRYRLDLGGVHPAEP